MYPRRQEPSTPPPDQRRVRWTPAVVLLVAGATVIYWLVRDAPSYEQHMRRGYDAAAIGRFPDAIEAFSRALSRRPDSAEAYRRRASAKMNIARFEPALEDLDFALTLHPEHAQALYDRAVVRYQLGQGADAVCPDLAQACRLGQHRACEQHRGAGCEQATRGSPAGG